MATKRYKDGAWRFTVKRKKLLPKPIYLTFDSEKEGDAYCERLEKLLNRKTTMLGMVISEYLERNTVNPEDVSLLNLIHKEQGKISIDRVSFTWAENWIALLKRAPSRSRYNPQICGSVSSMS